MASRPCGALINLTIKLPRLPPWLDLERCEGCGALYADHRGEYGFEAACQRMRSVAAADGDERGGYRSRGAVLWALRVLKAEDWLLAHIYCDPKYQDEPSESEEAIPF